MFTNYYAEQFKRAYNATPEIRRATLKHWEKIHAENKKNARFDLVIFSAENIQAVKAAETITNYINSAIVFFDYDIEKGLYTFDYTDSAPETFETYNAAAAFAEYNLMEIKKAGGNNEII